MPIFPNWATVPSEQTVEVLTNHYILHHLNKGAAWIFCPTRRQEAGIGYDASLQNTKIAIIQYKRIRVNSGSFNVTLNPQQHKTLMRRFPPTAKPYVFYVFSQYRTYADLNNGYRSLNAPEFFENTVFLNAHSIPGGDRSVTLAGAALTGNPSGTLLGWLNGMEWAFKLWDCDYGLTGAEAQAITAIDREAAQTIPANLTVVWWNREGAAVPAGQGA